MLSAFNPFPVTVRHGAWHPRAIDIEFDRLLGATAPVRSAFTGAADVVETEEAFEIQVDLPGVSDKDLQVSVENSVLTIKAERKAPARPKEGSTWHLTERTWGTFSRSFRLPRTADPAATTARFEHGVLVVRLPRRADAKPRTIEVKVSS